jgi:hypothetical protein
MRANRILALATLSVALLFSRSALAGKPFKNGPMTVVIDSPISTTLNKEGDSFVARVIAPTEIQGAIVEGHIRKIQAAQNGDAPKSHIVFAFETLTIGDTTYKIQADIKEWKNSKGVAKVDEEGALVAQGNGMKKAMFGLGGGGIGALAGGMIAGPVGGLAGGLAGGALGYAVSLDLTTSGKNMEFFPGSQFVIDVTDKGVNKDVNAEAVRNQDVAAIASQKPADASSPVPVAPSAVAADAPTTTPTPTPATTPPPQ